MSRKNFLNEINKMTRKGVYPSLNILLEEKDEDAMGGDNPFGDSESGESEETSEESEGESEEEISDSDDNSVSSAEAKSIEVSSQLSDINKSIEMINNKPDLTLFNSEFFPNASIVDNKNYNLKNFVIINEDSTPEKLEKSLKDIDDILNKDENKEKILQIKQKASSLNVGDKNFTDKIPGLVKDTISNIEHFDSLYDKASIAASDMLDIIEKQSPPEDLRKNVEEYVYQLAKSLDANKISHALNVKASEDNASFKNAEGGFNRG